MVLAMRRRLFKIAVFFLALAGFFAGLILLGQWALDQVRSRDRYYLAFLDIDVDPPPGMERLAFLDEVQYEPGAITASLPDRLNLLDDDLKDRLARTFAKHPWVAEVEEVRLVPPRDVQVRLIYRKPVLAVPMGKIMRAVDGEGILLPPQADTRGLPVFSGKASSPAGPAGTPWGDPAVEKRARDLSGPVSP